MADFRDTLMLPFLTGALGLPAPGERWSVLNADVLPLPKGIHPSQLNCEQGLRPKFLKLQEAGYTVEPELSDIKDQDACLVLAHRARAVNERNMMRGWNSLKSGGRLVFAGDKNSGVQSIRKWAGKLTDIGGSQSKHHAVVFWLQKEGDNWSQEVLKKPDSSFLGGDYKLAAGMFSADGPDAGSQVLVEQFNNRISGSVADFGAGWGYLSHELAKNCPGVKKLDLFEADWASLEAAKSNVGDTKGIAAGFHWCDLTQEPPKGPYDWVVMNPPFHTGRAAEPDLGKTFIKTAARVLPAGGRLLMVANSNLPYEKTLNSLFKKVERLDQKSGFKVLEAVKGSR